MSADTPIRTDVNYLRQDQIDEMKAERTQLERDLRNPDPRQQLQEKDEAIRAYRGLDKALHDQTPPQLTRDQVDAVVKEERELREKIVEGMPSQREMRANPPGVVGRHRAWQKRVKQIYKGTQQISYWKNLRRTMAANGLGDPHDPDIANIELYRPRHSYGNIDNARIKTRDYDFPSEQFKMNYDDIEWPERESEVAAEQAETQAAPSDPAPVTEPEAEPIPDPVRVSRCGKVCKNRQGKLAHERRCKKCLGEAAA